MIWFRAPILITLIYNLFNVTSKRKFSTAQMCSIINIKYSFKVNPQMMLVVVVVVVVILVSQVPKTQRMAQILILEESTMKRVWQYIFLTPKTTQNLAIVKHLNWYPFSDINWFYIDVDSTIRKIPKIISK